MPSAYLSLITKTITSNATTLTLCFGWVLQSHERHACIQRCCGLISSHYTWRSSAKQTKKTQDHFMPRAKYRSDGNSGENSAKFRRLLPKNRAVSPADTNLRRKRQLQWPFGTKQHTDKVPIRAETPSMSPWKKLTSEERIQQTQLHLPGKYCFLKILSFEPLDQTSLVKRTSFQNIALFSPGSWRRNET